MTESEYVGKIWWPKDINAAVSAAINTLSCTREFIDEVKAGQDAENGPYVVECMRTVLNSVQQTKGVVRPLRDEFRVAQREIDEPLPTVNGVSESFAHGLVVALGYVSLDAYTIPIDEGYSRKLHLTPGTMPAEEVQRMRDRFRRLETPSLSLIDVIRREAEQAARIRDRAKNPVVPNATSDETGKCTQGVAVFDAAMFFENDDERAATRAVKIWSDKKRPKPPSLGKCPIKGQRTLSELSEVVKYVDRLCGLQPKEKQQLREHLRSKLRFPVK